MRFKVEQLYDCVVTRIPKSGRLARLEVDTEISRMYVRRTGPNPGADMEGRIAVEPFIDEFMLLSDWLTKTTAMTGRLLMDFAEPPEDLIDTVAPSGSEHVFP